MKVITMVSRVEEEKNKILELVENHEYISFDIFDTAILREVFHPEDVFSWVEEALKRENSQILNFKKHRLLAEQLARKQSKAEDITFDQIYDCFPGRFSSEDKERAKSLELYAESVLTGVNPFILQIYNEAKTLGKRVFFVSDMYLSAEFLGKLLDQKGYHDIDSVFVSSETGVSKASTNMYSHIMKKMGIVNPSKWLHIGDNYIADVQNAESCGLHAYHYEKLSERSDCFRRSESLGNSILQALQINRYETAVSDYWEKFGAYFAFPIVYEFVRWLIHEIKGVDKIYFLSRDGYFPYVIYNKFRLKYPDLPEPIYMHASRRVFQTPSLLFVSKDEALEILTAYNPALGQQITLGEIFDNIGLPKDDQALKVIRDYGFHFFTDFIHNEHDRKRAKDVLTTLFDQVQRLLDAEHKHVLGYLRQFGIDSNTKEIHIVDIGWRGSTQRAIQLLTGIKTIGYYFGTESNVYPEIVDNVRSFAFHLGKPFRLARQIMSNVMMFEFIFSAPHGSAVKIVKKDGVYEPLLKEVENQDYFRALEKMEMGINEMIDQCIPKLSNVIVDRRIVVENYLTFINNKKFEDLIQFSQIKSAVGIGDTKTMQPYVTVVSLEEFRHNKDGVLEASKKNLWKNAILIRDSVEETRKIHSKRRVAFQHIRSFITMKRVLLAIRNPKKAIRFLLHFMRK